MKITADINTMPGLLVYKYIYLQNAVIRLKGVHHQIHWDNCRNIHVRQNLALSCGPLGEELVQ